MAAHESVKSIAPKAGDKMANCGLIGIGSMGKGLLYQSTITPGIRCVAVADTKVEKCLYALEWLGLPHRIVSTRPGMEAAIAAGLVAVCEDGGLIAESGGIDLVIEASSSIGIGGRSSVGALEHGKHLVLMNAEIDLIFGPYLMELARRQGVVCTSIDGDQYGVIKHLIDDLRFWGFELVMAGNIKGYLDRYANPTMIVPEADKRRLDYKMCTSYTDGTKLCIEMALTANAFGLRTAVPGMLGPRAASVQEALGVFDFDRLWGGGVPIVDYILGAAPGGGVFAVGFCENDYQRDMLAYYKMGQGPYYLFYRPYHLCHVEAMASILDAAAGRALLQPVHGFRTNVYAYAKRDLKRGEALDGLGGYDCYGLIENCDCAAVPGLPICLAEDLRLRRDVKRDARILWTDIEHDPSRDDLGLYAEAVRVSDGLKP